MNKNEFVKTPPMGWNSYDYYDTTVTEADVRANADYMAKYLKKYGWEYIVVDIEWYSNNAGERASSPLPTMSTALDLSSGSISCAVSRAVRHIGI